MSRHSLRVTAAWQVAIVKLKSIAETYLISARRRSLSGRDQIANQSAAHLCQSDRRVEAAMQQHEFALFAMSPE